MTDDDLQKAHDQGFDTGWAAGWAAAIDIVMEKLEHMKQCECRE